MTSKQWTPKSGEQLDLFAATLAAYESAAESISNAELYQELKRHYPGTDKTRKFGSDEYDRNEFEHKVRWQQQNLKRLGAIENVGRGEWQLTKLKRTELTKIKAQKHVLAMSTSLGIMIWSQQEDLLEKMELDEPIDLFITSPPYPIIKPRAYGGVAEQEMVDFICRVLEPVVKRLAQGGNIALNIGTCNEPGSPAKSMYPERVAIALHDRLGLKKMGNIIWSSNKNPVSSGPFATKNKINLMSAYEHVFWFTNDPRASFVDTRVIAGEHTEAHKKFVERGGVKQARNYADGAYAPRVGDYSTLRSGKLPRDVWDISNYCHRNRAVNKFAKQANLPTHGAKMPYELAHKAISLLSRKGKLVVDTMAGTLTVPQAANDLGRKWICCEQMLEYIQQGFSRFLGDKDVYFNPHLYRA